jgi:hypothetical protein
MDACAVDSFLTQIARPTRAQCVRVLRRVTPIVNQAHAAKRKAATGVFHT